MQDAHVVAWARDSHMPVEMLESLRELNHRFLDWVVSRPGAWNSPGFAGLSGDWPGRVAPLTTAQKRAAAGCPYALFDLRLHDDRHWGNRLGAHGPWSIAEAPLADELTREFVRLALFFAWHVAAARTPAAQLLLGMTDATAAVFRAATIDCLPAVADGEATHLTARWNHCATYWNALAGAASRPNPAALRRVQLYGLQLAAAARLDAKPG